MQTNTSGHETDASDTTTKELDPELGINVSDLGIDPEGINYDDFEQEISIKASAYKKAHQEKSTKNKVSDLEKLNTYKNDPIHEEHLNNMEVSIPDADYSNYIIIDADDLSKLL